MAPNSRTMDEVIVVQDDDSENSIFEVEIPRKPTPPLIEIEDEELILNTVEGKKELILAKNFIEKDQAFITMKETAEDFQNVISPSHWTSEMIKFYDDDWGDEDQFIVEKIQEKMDKAPSLWKVSRKDLLPELNSSRRSNVKCWNCGQRGHHFSLCPEEEHTLKCHMCGDQGHTDFACPNSKCLNCGSCSKDFVTCCYKCRNQENQICPRCHLVGHTFFNCPDHWRMFHLTTKTTSVRIPEKNIQKSEKNMWCCNCGKKGHYQIQCWNKKDLCAFKDTLPFVVSYQAAFDYNQCSIKSKGLPWRKNKGKRNNKNELEKTLRINPTHKPFVKNTIQFKKKKKRSRRKKKDKQRPRDGLIQAVA